MSNSSSIPKIILRGILKGILLMILALILLVLMSFSSQNVVIEILYHLIAGFVLFLNRNFAHLSFNAATWVPGIVCFVLALVLGHRFLQNWAIRRNRRWSFSGTLCLGLILPILFTTAFIVPGIMLQGRLLKQNPWLTTRGLSTQSYYIMQLRSIGAACDLFSIKYPDGRYPASLDELDLKNFISIRHWHRNGVNELPPEPCIYLGAGLTRKSDPTLPLCISPPYDDHGVVVRQLIRINGEYFQIFDREVDDWINRVIPPKTKPSE